MGRGALRFDVSIRIVDKLEDVDGLYGSPPEHALVSCVDEKSQIEALDRANLVSRSRGRGGTMMDDHKHAGMTTLFAALSILDEQVIGRCQRRNT